MRVSRFWKKVEKTEGCWIWRGAKIPDGYGLFWTGRRAELAHRVSYKINIGSIPQKLNICHRCDNRLCVRPSHLFAASQRENLEDAEKKGRLNRDHHGELNPNHKLILDDIRTIKVSSLPGVELASKYGVTSTLITQIRKGKRWRE